MRFSRFFITRPIFAAVISILITVMGGIAYFALPVDAIPDIFFLGLGFTDDAAVVVATLKAVANHVTDDHRAKAEDWLAQNA